MTRTKFKKIPFDLELAKKITNKEIKGRIISQAGHQVRIICFDKDGEQSDYPIVALIQIEPTDERMYTFSKEGVYSIGKEFFGDLMIEVPTYYTKYFNFVPQKWQPVLVRDLITDMWIARVATGERTAKGFGILSVAGENKFFAECLPISKLTIKLLYIAGKEHGFYKGRSEAYREFGHIIEHYKKLADAKNTATEGA